MTLNIDDIVTGLEALSDWLVANDHDMGLPDEIGDPREAAQALRSLEKENAELRAVAAKAAERFREYERMHLAKRVPMPCDVFFENAARGINEAAEKEAARNRVMAELCENALSRSALSLKDEG